MGDEQLSLVTHHFSGCTVERSQAGMISISDLILSWHLIIFSDA
jgi:hypothetical protein